MRLSLLILSCSTKFYDHEPPLQLVNLHVHLRRLRIKMNNLDMQSAFPRHMGHWFVNLSVFVDLKSLLKQASISTTSTIMPISIRQHIATSSASISVGKWTATKVLPSDISTVFSYDSSVISHYRYCGVIWDSVGPWYLWWSASATWVSKVWLIQHSN